MFCGIKSCNTVFECCLSALTQALNYFTTRLLPLPMIRYSKSAQKSAVQVCQVGTVVVKIVQLVLSQFKNFLPQPIEN